MKLKTRPQALAKAVHSFERLEPRAMLDAVPLLPDVFPWADQNRGYLYDWVIQGDLLRFTTAFANNGEGHLELRGGQIVNGQQEVFQRIFYSDGTFQDRLAGHFTYHPGHGHIHFDGYAIHNLRQVTAGNGVGDIVATGGKISFCLIDITKYNQNAGPSRYNSCGQVQGVTAGWSDVYSRNLADQWINISLVPDGEYWLEVVVDPDNLLLESNPDNNTARILVNINRGGTSGGDRWEPNNSFAAATPLGVFSHYHEVGLSIHNSTDQDYFRIGSPEHGEFDVHLNFTHALGNLDMFIYDHNQNLIASSTSQTDNEEIHFHAHPGEWYYVVVRGVGGATNGYELQIWGPGHVAVEVVDSTDVPKSIPDGIGSGNPGAWVSSTLVAPAIQITDLNLIFGRLDHTWLGDLEIQLVSPQGTVGKILTSQFQSGGGLLGSQDNFVNTRMDDQAAINLAQGTAPYTGWFRINHANTGANPLSVFNGENSEGIWTLRIRDWHSADAGVLRNWSIMITGEDLNPGDRFEPNNFFPQAVDLGTLGVVTIEDVNIHNTTDRDFFRFIAGTSAPAQIRVEFTHEKGNLDVLVYNSQLEEVARGDSHSDHEILDFMADANETYYIEVFGVQGAINEYTLVVNVAPVIGETGHLAAVNHVWQRVDFARTYSNPVVIVSPASYNDVNPATVTVANVTATGFDVRISRWNYQPPAHGTESLGYLVVEAGSHVLADGSRLVAGSTSSVSHAWQLQPFGTSFAAPPVVLAQVTSAYNNRTTVPRIANVSAHRFSLRIQDQESYPTNRYTPQSVQWIALQRGQDFAGNWQYQAGTLRAPNQNPINVFYENTFRDMPTILAGVQTFMDADPVTIRLTDVKSNKFTFVMQEEQSADAEMMHGGELVGYLAFSGPWLFGQGGSSLNRLASGNHESVQPKHDCGCSGRRTAKLRTSDSARSVVTSFAWGSQIDDLATAIADRAIAEFVPITALVPESKPMTPTPSVGARTASIGPSYFERSVVLSNRTATGDSQIIDHSISVWSVDDWTVFK
ncbi:MAG TPA: lysyl oxidase family protein [Pirellulaceae bacterium]|nr:lysyl oxidase family protein [Pirellulaceae bacterium]